MCIAIIKPAGVAMPKQEIFTESFSRNRDGAGFSYSSGTEFVTIKGLMSIEAFNTELEHVIKRCGKETLEANSMAFHFRIGTHGSKNDPKHTHPFPMSANIKSLESLKFKSKAVIMHNGILAQWGSNLYGQKGRELSDTMDFIKNYICPLQILMAGKRFDTSGEAQKIVTTAVAGSRFVIMYPDGGYVYWGQWVKDGGLLFSNAGYKPVITPEKSQYNWPKHRYGNDSNFLDQYFDGWHAKRDTQPIKSSAYDELYGI